MREQIAAAFPDDRVLGEEEGGDASGDGRVWIVDPIDATANFARGDPDLGDADRAAGRRRAGRSASRTRPALGERYEAVTRRRRDAERRRDPGERRVGRSTRRSCCSPGSSAWNEDRSASASRDVVRGRPRPGLRRLLGAHAGRARRRRGDDRAPAVASGTTRRSCRSCEEAGGRITAARRRAAPPRRERAHRRTACVHDELVARLAGVSPAGPQEALDPRGPRPTYSGARPGTRGRGPGRRSSPASGTVRRRTRRPRRERVRARARPARTHAADASIEGLDVVVIGELEPDHPRDPGPAIRASSRRSRARGPPRHRRTGSRSWRSAWIIRGGSASANRSIAARVPLAPLQEGRAPVGGEDRLRTPASKSTIASRTGTACPTSASPMGTGNVRACSCSRAAASPARSRFGSVRWSSSGSPSIHANTAHSPGAVERRRRSPRPTNDPSRAATGVGTRTAVSLARSHRANASRRRPERACGGPAG